MKIDIEYIAKILQLFIDSEKAHLSIVDIETMGVDIGAESINEEFLFHIQILLDNQLISDQDGGSSGLQTVGILLNGNGTYRKKLTNIRLTQKGHDFVKALGKKEIIERLKNELKDAPFKAIFEGSQQLLNQIIQKKIDQILKT